MFRQNSAFALSESIPHLHLRFGIGLLVVLFTVFNSGVPSAWADQVYHSVSAGMLTVSQYPGWGAQYANDPNADDNTNCVVTLGLNQRFPHRHLQPRGL